MCVDERVWYLICLVRVCTRASFVVGAAGGRLPFYLTDTLQRTHALQQQRIGLDEKGWPWPVVDDNDNDDKLKKKREVLNKLKELRAAVR